MIEHFLIIEAKGRVTSDVDEKMLEIARRNGGNLMDQNSRNEIAEYFRGKTVIAQYGNYRAYRIGEVTTDRDITNTFLNIRTKDGKNSDISIVSSVPFA